MCGPMKGEMSVVKWRRLRWARRMARMRGRRNPYTILVGKHLRKSKIGRSEGNGRITLRWILGR